MRLLTAAIACALALAASAPPAFAKPRVPFVPVPEQYAAVKCARVEYHQVGQPRTEAGTAYETILAVFTFADGHNEQALFPYPWVFANAQVSDPWSAEPPPSGIRYVRTAVQRPPAGFDLSTLPPLIALVLAYTNEQGLVNLPECGKSEPPMTESNLNSLLWRPADRNTAAAQIEITRKYFYYGTEYLPRTIGSGYAGAYSYDGECVSFMNRAPRAATRIRFLFTYIGASGTILGSDSLERRGSFAPNVLIEGLRERISPTSIPAARMAQNCVTPKKGTMNGPLLEVRGPDGRPAIVNAIRLSVEAVDYDDGTTWRAPQLEPDAAP